MRPFTGRSYALMAASSRRDQYVVDLPGYVTLQAAHGLPLALALGGASCQILLCAPIRTHTHYADHVQSAVGVPVATTVKPMTDYLARGSLYGRDAAEAGERGLVL